MPLQEYLERFRSWLEGAGFEAGHVGTIEAWRGSIVVDWFAAERAQSEQFSHGISILLPPGFPYRAPIVLSTDDPPLKSSWHLAPEPVYSLCLWRAADGWQPHFTAQRLLARIQEWFYCYHTNDWPMDAEMPDLHLYLDCLGIVAISDGWNPPRNERVGQFAFWRANKLSSHVPCLATCDSRHQLKSRDLSAYPAEVMCFPVYTRFHHQAGVWFWLSTAFVPPPNLAGLLSLIDSHCEMSSGWAAKSCIQAFGSKPVGEGFPLALGYTDSQQKERWLFLWVQLPQDGKKRHKISWSSVAHLSTFPVKSFRTAPARAQDRLSRVAASNKQLNQKRAIIFGVGSLGGSIALLLAKAGIREIRLVDDDILLPGNVIRHICGMDWVGVPKTHALRYIIQRHNPECVVEVFDTSWDIEKLLSYMAHADVVIDATADRNYSLFLNEICIDRNFPAIYATAHRHATVGRIFVRRHNDDPCLACYSEPKYNWKEHEYPIIPPLSTDSIIEDGCGTVTEEAVAVDIEAVANLTARIAIKVMQRELEDGNLALIINEPISGASALLAQAGIHWRNNMPLHTCGICRD